MKYLHSDSLDRIHPDYDFRDERETTPRHHASHDLWPHEFFAEDPYAGILISHATVGRPGKKGRYSLAQRMALGNKGARGFLNYPSAARPGSWTMGDSGSFSTVSDPDPPDVEETVRFYAEAGFTHGLSPDAIIFRFDRAGPDLDPTEGERHRFNATLEAARAFIALQRRHARDLEPVATIQGWNSQSLGDAARAVSRMWYGMIAVGGLVPLDLEDIDRALGAVRAGAPGTRLHALGYAKPLGFPMLRRHGVGSFDTASPMLRSVKDAKLNYWTMEDAGLGGYAAVRLPRAHRAHRLLTGYADGSRDYGKVAAAERDALDCAFGYGDRRVGLEQTLDAIDAYWQVAGWQTRGASMRRAGNARTLAARPWEPCGCRACSQAGVAIVFLRSAATNRRRGLHNMQVLQRSTEG